MEIQKRETTNKHMEAKNSISKEYSIQLKQIKTCMISHWPDDPFLLVSYARFVLYAFTYGLEGAE